MSTPLLFSSPEKAVKKVLKDQLASYLSTDALDTIYRAFLFAEKAHRGQTRKSGEPYIYHPIAVASNLAELKMDADSIVAALLHDVIEDTPANKEDIESAFGKEVAHLVDGLSKIGQVQFVSKEQAEAANFRKMLMAMSSDVRVMIIKLADRLHNISTLAAMPRKKQLRIIRQTLDVYAPIAERLGLYHWSKQLQDLSFQQLYPKRYNALQKALQQLAGNRKRTVERLKQAFQEAIQQSNINHFVIKGRRKTAYSTYLKMVSKKRSFREIHDIYGFRIIVENLEDCYRVLGSMHNAYKPIPGRFADYIAIPKENGYQSLHTVVFSPFGHVVEIQIRTKKMDKVAEAGVAAHWVYKTGDELPSSTHLTRQWLLDLLSHENHVANPAEFLEHLKTDLYPDEVYVFTPKGDIKKLPKGATALDFAYAVHSDVGTHCTGARINQVLVPLPTLLKNGDCVTIITAKHAFPNAAWLNYAMTAKARTKIRQFLNQQTEKEALKLGKRLLNSALKQNKWRLQGIAKDVQKQLLADLQLKKWDELLVEIGLGKRLPSIVAKQLAAYSNDEKGNTELTASESLVIKGAEGVLLSYAKCCLPLPGDPIVGTFTVGQGLVIHRASCPNLRELRKKPERCLLVEWGEAVEEDFNTKLEVFVRRTTSDVAKVISAIAENSANIRHIELKDNDTTLRQIHCTIDVNHRVHLAKIIKSVKRLSHVEKVYRHKG